MSETDAERDRRSDDPADEVPHPAALPEDPYTPAPGPRAGERRPFRFLWLAWAVVVIAIAIVVWAALR
jgi:hypothetical protein